MDVGPGIRNADDKMLPNSRSTAPKNAHLGWSSDSYPLMVKLMVVVE